MNIVIVGAGPVGSYAAYLLARKGFQVDLYDSKKEIGKPVQCTGIFPAEIKKFVKLDKSFLINVVRQVELFSKHQKAVFNKEEYVIDRTKFDKYLLNLAVEAGVNFHAQHKLKSIKKNQNNFNQKKYHL